MSKSNEHKKDFREDKFARVYYCQHARLNQLREDKKQSRRKTRRKNKKLLQNNYFVFIFVAQVLIDVVVMIVVSNKFCKEK